MFEKLLMFGMNNLGVCSKGKMDQTEREEKSLATTKAGFLTVLNRRGKGSEVSSGNLRSVDLTLK